MAFINAAGQSISYDCSVHKSMLKKIIEESGDKILVNVLVEKKHGVELYKNFFTSYPPQGLPEDSELRVMPAKTLLALYEKEMSII